MSSQVQGEFAAREDAARELGVVTDRLQGGWQLQEDERDMLLRKQQQLTCVLEQHSTQVMRPLAPLQQSLVHVLVAQAKLLWLITSVTRLWQ